MSIVLKSGSLNPLESSWPVQGCNGIALPLPFIRNRTNWCDAVTVFHTALIHVYVLFGRPCTSDFSPCYYCDDQMTYAARTGDCFIVAIKKLQHVPFQGRHDCRLTTACTNETHINKWVRAHGLLSPHFLLVKPKPSKAKEFSSVLAFKEVCDCEILN